MNRPFKILLVCTGNTCRSPMAEGILKALIKERGLDGEIHVSSAGVNTLDGLPATPNAIEAAKVWNIDIAGHRSRQLTREMVDEADLILAMSPEHAAAIMRRDIDSLRKTYLIKGFPSPFSTAQEGVQDPIGGTLDEYNQTYLELDEVLRRIEGKLIELSRAARKE